MKRTLLIILSSMMLLTSCGARTDIASDTIGTTSSINDNNQNLNIGSSSVGIGDSNVESTDNISNTSKGKVSDYEMSDYDFSAWFYDYYGDSTHQPTWNKYNGTIQDENIKKQLFDLVCQYETGIPIDGGSVGGSDCAELYLTNKSTGERFAIYFSIWYASPELDGGPEVMNIHGNYYGAETGDSDIFYSLIGQAIMKDENLTSLGNLNTQTTTSEVNNQLTKEDRRSEIMLISQYTNWAEEYQNYGYFVTIYGDVYEFDFSNSDTENMFPNEKTDFLTELVNMMEEGQISRFENVNVSGIPYLLPEVDANGGWKNIFNANDMGQTTLYGVRPNVDNTDMEIIKLYSYGDNIDILQDANAQEICAIWLGDEYIIE